MNLLQNRAVQMGKNKFVSDSFEESSLKKHPLYRLPFSVHAHKRYYVCSQNSQNVYVLAPNKLFETTEFYF